MLSEANRFRLQDSALPGLELALDLPQFADQLSQLGHQDFLSAGLDYIRYKPGRRCVALYRQRVACQSNEMPKTWVVSALTSEGFAKRCRRLSRLHNSLVRRYVELDIPCQVSIEQFPLDSSLPSLIKFNDPDHRQRMLRRLTGQACRGSHFQALAYKPARRFVAAVQDESDQRMIVKFYERTQFQATKRRLQALQNLTNACPKVIGASQRYDALALQWLPGEPLHRFLHQQDSRARLMQQVGFQLAQFHQCGLAESPALQTASDRSTVESSSTRGLGMVTEDLKQLDSELGCAASDIVQRLVCGLQNTDPKIGLIHGDFYNKQVVTDGQTIHFIDFDQSRIGDIFQDLGNFVAQLYWRYQLNEYHLAWIDETVQHLIDGYQTGTRVAWNEQRFHLQVAAGLVRCLLHPFRHAVDDWQAGTTALLKTAEAYLMKTKRVDR